MNIKNLIIILLVAYFATFLRFYIGNNFIISIIGSFLYGLVIGGKIRKSRKEIILFGFCSCFTSFSGFIYFLYQLIDQGFFLKLFIYLNLIVIFNVIIMYVGFLISRKMT